MTSHDRVRGLDLEEGDTSIGIERRLPMEGHERRARLPLAFVILALVALVAAPILMDRRTEPLRGEIEAVLAPARSLVNEAQSSLATELSLVRGYLLTGDAPLIERYRQVRDDHLRLYEQLRPLVHRVGPDAVEQFGTLRALVDRRHAHVESFLRGEVPREDFTAQLPERQSLFEQAIVAAEGLETTIRQRERAIRAEIQHLRRINRVLTFALVLLALLASLIVGRLATRMRERAEEELALRRVAHALTGSLSTNQILRWIAANALTLTRADATHVERVNESAAQVEVVATAGSGCPPLHARFDYPGSLTREMLERGVPRLVKEPSGAGTALAEFYGRGHPGGSALVVPLVTEESVLGSLVLLRRAGRPAFSEKELLRASALADLASLSLRKVLLLEEARRHRAELEQYLETRTRLIRGISHDLKNPLGAADGYAELLETGLKGELSPGQKEYVGRIRRMHRSMLDIIRYLLDLARSGRGDLPIERAPTDVGSVAREVVEDYRAQADLAGLVLQARIPDELPPVQTDPARVREILGNLISNAIKYSESGGEVCVRVAAQGDDEDPGRGWMVIDVEDTGPGIAPENLERIFQEYQRLDEVHASGAGIGLAISRKIARLLGGDIIVSSAPGEGSIFTLRLPAVPPGLPVEPTNSAGAARG